MFEILSGDEYVWFVTEKYYKRASIAVPNFSSSYWFFFPAEA